SANDGTLITSRTAGMVNSQFLGMALDPSNRNRIFGGVIDNGMFRRPDAGGTAWDFIFSGDGFECAVSDNSSVALQSIQNEFILRTRNPGAATPFYTDVSPPLGTESP